MFMSDTHEGNIEELVDDYVDFPKEIIECIYSYACLLDKTSAILASKVQKEEITRDEALNQLKVDFDKFGENERTNSLERQLEELGVF